MSEVKAKPSPSLVRKVVTLSPAMVDRVEDYRYQNRIADQTEAFRRLIDIALNGGAVTGVPEVKKRAGRP